MYRFALAAMLLATLSARVTAQDSVAVDFESGRRVRVATGDVNVDGFFAFDIALLDRSSNALDGDDDVVPEHMLMEVYTIDEAEEPNVDDPVLMVISSRHFWNIVETYDFVDMTGDEVVFTRRMAKKGQEEYVVITLKPVYVMSHQSSGSGG